MRSITKLALGLTVVMPVQAMEQHMDAMPVAKLAVDHLEQRFDGDDQALSWELEGTYGNDLHKAVLRSSGERADGGPTESSETQLLYRRMASEFFDWQAGVLTTTSRGRRAAMPCSASRGWRHSGSSLIRICSSASAGMPRCAWKPSTNYC